MPLDGNRLGTAIKTAVLAVPFPQDAESGDPELEAFWQAVGNAIVTEITSNAIVTSNGATGGHTAGGPAPIANLAGEIT